MTEVNFPSEWIQRVRNEIIFSTNNGLSGAVASFSLNNDIIYQEAHGFQRKYNELELMPNPEPAKLDTIFDLASLTKIFSTTLGFMKLVDEKRICVDDKEKKYIPEFSGGYKDVVTIKQLLQHNSGYASDFHFYNPKLVSPNFYSQTRSKTIELLPKVPLLNKPGTVTVYSDLNFVMLGIILEKVTSMRQDEFIETVIYKPLGLKNTGYALLQKGFPKNRFEASERCGNTRDGHITFPNIRTKTIQGEVQDETAFYSMEQISGNAGLFSTVNDLTVLCQLILNKGQFGGYRLCSEEVVNLFTCSLNIDKSYTLGFQVPSIHTELIYGMLLPEAGTALGHTGWTGKCFLIDFTHNSIILILNNKKHSPVIPIGNDFNRFEGGMLPTSIYGGTNQLFYAGILESKFGCK